MMNVMEALNRTAVFMDVNSFDWNMSTGQLIVAVLGGCLLLLWFSWELSDDRRKNVPKGTLGHIPICGHSLDFILNGPKSYAASRFKKYGDVFKGSFLGMRVLVSVDPEFSYLRDLRSQDENFKVQFPRNLRTMMGETYNMSGEQEALRKIAWSQMGPEVLKTRFPDIEALVLDGISKWDGQTTIELSTACKKITTEVSILMLIGKDPSEKEIRNEIRELIPVFNQGVTTLPVYFPGTEYYKAYQARLRIRQLLAALMKTRANSPPESPLVMSKDILEALMRYKTKEGKKLTLNQLSDVIFFLVFASQDTMTSALICGIGKLGEIPDVYKTTLAECNAIARSKASTEALTYEDIKNMQYIPKIFKETLRYYTIVPFTIRQAVKETTIKGYIIPKDWYVMTMLCNLNAASDFWVKPEEYNPSRFDTPPKPKVFNPFGAGTHMCPGSSLAQTTVSIFLYHLVVRYSWKLKDVDQNGKLREERSMPPVPAPTKEVLIEISKHAPL